MKKNVLRTLAALLTIIVILGIWVAYDLKQNDKIVRTDARTDHSRDLVLKGDDIMIQLEEGDIPDYKNLAGTLDYIEGRYGCSDFRVVTLIRVLYDHDQSLTEQAEADLKATLTGFKYWMDQPGHDSMCYWSENHQLLFSTAEYLLGHYYADETFTNMGITGAEHSELGKARVLTWLEQRFNYGFTEWYSSTYYVEDIAPLSVLIDFAPDEEIRLKATMILDLMVYDLATQNYKGTFTANSGRMYESAKMSGRSGSMKESISLIWPEYNTYLGVEKIGGMEANFKYIKNYEVPEVLVNIGYDQDETKIYKASNGVNLSEYKDEGLLGIEDHQIMMQLASEAFTNPEVIGNTIKYVDKNDMFPNEFLNDFKLINLGVIKTFNLAPTVSRLLDPMYDGTAIQRANTYMYRTPDYAMSTAQAYHPGTYGDQHSLFSLNMNNDFNIFVQHPAASLTPDGALSGSPNYWTGNGYIPHTVQEKNVNINLLLLPEKVNALGDLAGMARAIEPYTHAFFPKQYMDEVLIDGNYAFGKLDHVYVALIGKNDLVYKPFANLKYDQDKGYTMDYDLIQDGLETYWITEVGTESEYGSFEDFMKEIQSRQVTYENQTLTYQNLELTYQGDFKVNGDVMDLEYDRFDSEYSLTERKADVITFEFEGQSLTLDFKNGIREVKN